MSVIDKLTPEQEFFDSLEELVDIMKEMEPEELAGVLENNGFLAPVPGGTDRQYGEVIPHDLGLLLGEAQNVTSGSQNALPFIIGVDGVEPITPVGGMPARLLDEVEQQLLDQSDHERPRGWRGSS